MLADVVNQVPAKRNVNKLSTFLVLPWVVALRTTLVKSDLLRNTLDASEMFSSN